MLLILINSDTNTATLNIINHFITVMKTKAFKERLSGFDELTSRQRQALLSQLGPVAIQKTVIVELENSIQSDCPYCHSQKIGRWGYQSRL